jgi:hypothetical protein
VSDYESEPPVVIIQYQDAVVWCELREAVNSSFASVRAD